MGVLGVDRSITIFAEFYLKILSCGVKILWKYRTLNRQPVKKYWRDPLYGASDYQENRRRNKAFYMVCSKRACKIE